jgi:hypothetical protein
VASDPAVQSLLEFLEHREAEGAVNAPIPNEPEWATFMQHAFSTLSADILFPLVDLFRASLADPRVSGWFAEEKGIPIASPKPSPPLTLPQDHATIKTLLTYATTNSEVPYPLRLVTTQTLCNLFTTPLFPPHLLSPPLLQLVTSLITSFLPDRDHAALRAAASSAAFAVAAYVQKQRSTTNQEVLTDGPMVELAASVLEGIQQEEESNDVVRNLALSLALLTYCCPDETAAELKDMLGALEAGRVLTDRGEKVKGDEIKQLCNEVKGLVEA